MSKAKPQFPQAHFGKANHKPMDWDRDDEDDDADDVELEKTPKHVTGMLGFDPKKSKTKGK